jgi:tRNA A-37 threonylcarbamoyl transferase component Bud32
VLPSLRKYSNKKDFVNFSFRGFRLKIFKEYLDEKFLEMFCTVPSGEVSGFRRVASSVYAMVYCFEYEGRHFFYKSFLHRNRLEPMKEILRGSRAERALSGHLLLQENGLFTPQVVVIGKKGPHNFMVSKAIENGMGLHQYFRDEFTPSLEKEKIRMKREIICKLGHTIGRMHALGIYHGDLGLGNVIFVPSNPLNSRYAFLDNERTVYYKRLPNRKIVKNLAQLNMIFDSTITNTDRLRFFRAYLKENPELLIHKESLIHSIFEKTAKRVARKAKKNT